ncbi:MAG: UDP-glucose 4-epimerase GalE [Bdellovibrionales bacterium]|nr:UDP-glucose 4-epimerase GalE [Bdellovibrionales bacterium]
MRVLVVGGAGYVGSHAAKRLAREGHSVFVLDDLSTGHRELARYGELIEGTVLSEADVAAALEKALPDCVMHFAARALVGESMENPALYYQVNVQGSMNLFDAVRRLRPGAKLVFSSTCSLYGDAGGRLDESLPLRPVNPYGTTKKLVEDLLRDYSRAYGMRSVCLRYFNAAGADSEGELGEIHEPETHLIPRLLRAHKHGAIGDFRIHGGDYPTRDGTCVRDYIHVEDLADAHVRAMDYLLRGGGTDVFNLGTEKGSSVLEVARAVERATGARLDLSTGPRRAGDPAELVAVSEKAGRVLGWRARHDLDSVVRSAWAFIEKHPRL